MIGCQIECQGQFAVQLPHSPLLIRFIPISFSSFILYPSLHQYTNTSQFPHHTTHITMPAEYILTKDAPAPLPIVSPNLYLPLF